jgi:ubiquinone/menaquinone biosynthesis C-methylase UbiE
MTFDVTASAYGQFMGRFSEPLAAKFMALAPVTDGRRVLDVGCGPGALTARLVERLGAGAVSALDPSASFVAALHERLPDVDVRLGSVAQVPFPDETFDAAYAQLVVHFMPDPVAGLVEMARVTRHGGSIGACVWDHAGGAGPLAVFWRAVRELDPQAPDESNLPGAREGHLRELFEAAGLQDVQPSVLTVRVGYATFEEWWAPFTLGVGPAGGYVARLDDEQREGLRASAARLLPDAPFEIAACAWTAFGRVHHRR